MTCPGPQTFLSIEHAGCHANGCACCHAQFLTLWSRFRGSVAVISWKFPSLVNCYRAQLAAWKSSDMRADRNGALTRLVLLRPLIDAWSASLLHQCR